MEGGRSPTGMALSRIEGLVSTLDELQAVLERMSVEVCVGLSAVPVAGLWQNISVASVTLW